MTLSDTALVMLSAAAQRGDHGIEVPVKLKGAAALRLIEKLQKEGLVETVRARGSLPVWRRDDETGNIGLRITKHGLKAIRVDAEAGPDEQGEAARATRRNGKLPVPFKPAARQRDGSKQAQVITLLRQRGGATIAAIMQATGWQQHSVRGFLAGAVRKRLGLTLVSEVIDGKRVYRIPGQETDAAAPKKSRRTAA